MAEPIGVDNETILGRMERESIEAEGDIAVILNIAEFDFDELKDIENPNVLVLGVGPYGPEVVKIQEWSQENGKDITVDLVDKSMSTPGYLERVSGLKDDDHFRMNAFEMDFSDFPFDKRYNVIFLLRFSDLSRISDDVFARIVESLEDKGIFIMSGGLNNRFNGNALHDGNMQLEKAEQIPYSFTDLYKTYIGKNSVIKLRKIGHGV